MGSLPTMRNRDGDEVNRAVGLLRRVAAQGHVKTAKRLWESEYMRVIANMIGQVKWPGFLLVATVLVGCFSSSIKITNPEIDGTPYSFKFHIERISIEQELGTYDIPFLAYKLTEVRNQYPKMLARKYPQWFSDNADGAVGVEIIMAPKNMDSTNILLSSVVFGITDSIVPMWNTQEFDVDIIVRLGKGLEAIHRCKIEEWAYVSILLPTPWIVAKRADADWHVSNVSMKLSARDDYMLNYNSDKFLSAFPRALMLLDRAKVQQEYNRQYGEEVQLEEETLECVKETLLGG